MTLVRPLTDILAGMPQWQGDSLKEIAPDPSFSVWVPAPVGYVEPEIEIEDTAAGSVLLLTAPGAMGKSSAAQFIANSTRAPLVDLARKPVGGNTMTGLLTEVLGWEQAPKYILALQHGSASLVLDGLDEAQLLAGREHFLAFLTNLASLIKSASQQMQVIMLGRPDASDTTFLALQECGIQVVRARIAPLGFKPSCDLIDNVLDNASWTVHRTHVGPFASLRNDVFNEVAAALDVAGDTPAQYWPAVKEFLGYPPVLLALAERLRVENPGDELSLRHGEGRETEKTKQRGQLLIRIVESILDRESLKVRGRLAEPLALDSSDAVLNTLYSREEQCLRVASFASGVSLRMTPPESLDDQRKAAYNDQIEMFLPDHPFLADKKFTNVVFSDYVRATITSSPLCGAYGSSRGQLLSRCEPIGPFFAEFVSVTMAGELSPTIDEDLVEELLISHVAGVTGVPSIVYFHRDNTCTLHLDEDSPSAARDAVTRILEFEIPNPSGVLQLSVPLSHAAIVTDHALILSGPNGQIEIGPNVFIAAGEIELRAKRFVALGRTADGDTQGIVLIAGACAHEAGLKVQSEDALALSIAWKDPWHQWKPYVVETSASEVYDQVAAMEVLVGLRRILLSFRSGAGTDPSIVTDKMDRVIVGPNPSFRATFAGLRDLEVIVRDGVQYRLRTEVLSSYGVNYAALRGPEYRSVLRKLFEAVCKTAPVAALVQKQDQSDERGE